MLPSSVLSFSTCGDFYARRVQAVEDSIRAFAILLPGRFEDADICSQAILACLHLVSLCNTHLLDRHEPEFAFNAAIRKHYYRHRLGRAAAVSLSFVSCTEVLWEMLWRRRSRTSVWRWITGIELTKFFLRLVLFYGNRQRMVLHPTHLVRYVDPTTLTVNTTDKPELTTLDPRIGTPCMLLMTTADDKILKPRKSWAHASELLWMARPVVYTIMIMRLVKSTRPDGMEKDEENAWRPWLVSLCIDIMSRIARDMQPMTLVEQEESRRRDYLWLYYLLRGPIYSKLTSRILEVFCNATDHRPLISIVTAALNDYRPFWEQSYFYTAGS